MTYDEARRNMIETVNEALKAGLQGRDMPDPLKTGDDICTDNLLGQSGDVRPTISYRFPYSTLGDMGASFAEEVTSVWRNRGMEITNTDGQGIFQRYAVSDDGFRYKMTANPEIDQVSIGGSGPCVNPPE
jgi:hypothetical protein